MPNAYNCTHQLVFNLYCNIYGFETHPVLFITVHCCTALLYIPVFLSCTVGQPAGATRATPHHYIYSMVQCMCMDGEPNEAVTVHVHIIEHTMHMYTCFSK